MNYQEIRERTKEIMIREECYYEDYFIAIVKQNVITDSNYYATHIIHSCGCTLNLIDNDISFCDSFNCPSPDVSDFFRADRENNAVNHCE